MPNIKQQKKRVGIAARQREENLRYRSTVKTLTKRLEAAVEDGDAETIAAEHRTLVRWVDQAASKGALHANTAARKKAQAARLVAGSCRPGEAFAAQPAGKRHRVVSPGKSLQPNATRGCIVHRPPRSHCSAADGTRTSLPRTSP